LPSWYRFCVFYAYILYFRKAGLNKLNIIRNGDIIMKGKLRTSSIVIFLITAITFTGCTWGEGPRDDSTPAPTSSVQVLPTDYDFGIVTLGNTPVPLEAKILNNGSAQLKVSDIVISDSNNFALDLGGGSNPCSSSSPTIGAEDYCTVDVSFNPQFVASYNASLQIESNDSSNPSMNIQLIGSAELIESLSVRINEVESDLQCPVAKVTAYVSVIDQGGYAVTGLTEDNFTVTENINLMSLTDFTFVAEVTAPISVSLVMDYSGSITDIPEAVSDMEDAVVYFVDQLGIDDEAEIIKHGTEVEVVQGFTSDKNLLTDAIFNPTDIGRDTSLYDATWLAVDDTALRLKARKAVIILTDGKNTDSNYILSDVISYANDKGIPIFTIGLGNINTSILEQIADDTGGQVFNSASPDNLKNTYNQLADILFENQYILEYISAVGFGETADLTIEAATQTVMGDDTKEITPCP
jgi:VWFA-related protein